MTFNIRHFLRHVPARTLKLYFEARNAGVPIGWWGHKSHKLAHELTEFLSSSATQVGETVMGEFARVHPMACERGRTALFNASARQPEVLAKFGELENDQERSLWILLQHPEIFREGEELRFFDYYSEGHRGRHYKVAGGLGVSRAQEDVRAFKTDVCHFHRNRDGSGVSCAVEFADRHHEESTQVSIYIQGLPNNSSEFVKGEFVRRVSNPALEAAIVYNPSNGQTSTVTKGGRPVHDFLRDSFARNLLKIDPQFSQISREPFHLDSLREPRLLAADPDLGVQTVRVRKLKLAPHVSGAGFLTVEAPGGLPETSVYDVGNSWFPQGCRFFQMFMVVHATIAMHFHAAPKGKRAKTLNIELTLPNISNLKDLPGADRRIAEHHLKMWKLSDPSA